VEELRGVALRGALWSALQQLGDRGFRVLIYLVLARLVLPDAFGLVALASVFIEFGQICLNQGLTAAIVQREELEPDHIDSAFWGNVVFGLMIGVAVYAGSNSIADLARNEDLSPVVRWLAISFPIASLSGVQEALLRRELRFKALAIRSFVSQTTAGVVSLVLAFLGAGVWSIVALELVRRAVGTVVLWAASDWRPGLNLSYRHYLDLLSFGIHIMGVAIVTFFRNRSDYYLIGVFLGTTALGFYSVARQLVNSLTGLINGSVGEVMWTTFARLQSDPARLSRAISQGMQMLATMAWPVFLGGFAVAPELVPVVLGARWAPSVPIVQAFLLCSCLLVASGSLMSAITAIGETRLRLGVEVATAIVTLAAVVLAVPRGIEAVGWAYAGALLLLLPLQAGLALRRLPLLFREFLASLRVPAVASLTMLGILLGFRALTARHLSPAALLVSMILLGAAVYAAAIQALAPSLARQVLANVRLGLGRPPTGLDKREIQVPDLDP
jgi:PST family polysaccharide transporter